MRLFPSPPAQLLIAASLVALTLSGINADPHALFAVITSIERSPRRELALAARFCLSTNGDFDAAQR